MVDVARTDREIKHLSKAHDDAFQRGEMAATFDWPHKLDYQRGSDFVEGVMTQVFEHVSLESAALILVADDAPLF